MYHCFGLPSNCEAVLMVFKLLCCSLYVSQDHVGVYSEHQIKFSKVTAAVWHFDPHLLTGLQLYMHASIIYVTYMHIVRHMNASTYVCLLRFGNSLLAPMTSVLNEISSSPESPLHSAVYT